MKTVFHGQVTRQGYAIVIMKSLNLLLILSLNVLLARTLGAKQLGIYAFTISVVTILSIPAMAGLPILLTREVAKIRLTENWKLLKGMLIRAFQFSFVLSILLGVGVALSVWIITQSNQKIMQASVLLIALPLIPIKALSELRIGVLSGFKKIIEARIPEMLILPFCLMGLIVVIAVSGPVTARDAVLAHMLAAMIAFVVGAYFMYRVLRVLPWSKTKPTYEHRSWLNSMVPLTLLAGMQIINGQTDIVVLGMLATKEEVGLYRIAMQGATLVLLGLYAVGTVTGPYIAQFYTMGDQKRLQELTTIGSRVSVAWAIFATVVLAGFGDTLLVVLFGEEFGGSYQVLVILSIGYLFSVCFGFVIVLLTMTGHEEKAMRAVAMAAVINVILNVVFIPPFGMIGAASATVTSFLIGNILLFRIVRQKLGIDTLVFYRQAQG